MSNRSIMVDLKFQADTSQAKAKMKELQTSLSQLQSISNQNLPMNQLSSGLDQAKNAAAQLQVQLKSAFNQNTGKLDLSRFNQQLQQSGMSLEKYKVALMQAGPAGKQAFEQLAVQIASADTHVTRISSRMAQLGKTLANTFRWQISSAALMAVTSTIRTAYQYAQDLNASLNDIRIVTGYSADHMDKFAKKANEAAQALSTTTTEYTKASLIFFQQGLNSEEVEKRTAATIKMANATGQSVETISSQLTAVWNNFYDGSKSLEYYADVMTALGAATASSTDEIAEGLEKFIAIGETVGLSYEYATSALATVTAQTRQSADVVGTAFKTLFARIQDLELGKTLDDGTTLGQYSQALHAVGINIKDVNGQVKDMNTILDEMGAKWGSLTKDQQIALAQNVAGVRQYTQLIALMDNWGTFQNNVNIGLTSTGELDRQAGVYAESWQAARDEVTAALESIYKAILDDDAFIDILHFFADLFKNINGVIESVGGLRGVILLLSTALLNLSKNSLAASMTSLGRMMGSLTAAGREKIQQTRTEAFNKATTMYDEGATTGALRNDQIRSEILLEQEYLELSKNVTLEEKEILRIRKDQLAVQNAQAKEKIAELEAAEAQASKAALGFRRGYGKKFEGWAPENTTLDDMARQAQQAGAADYFTNELSMGAPVYEANMAGYLSGKTDDSSLKSAGAAVDDIRGKMDALGVGTEAAEEKLRSLFGDEAYQALEAYYQKIIETQQRIKELSNMTPEQRNSQQQPYEKAKAEMAAMNKGGRMTKRINRGETGEDVERFKSLKKQVDQQEGLVKSHKKVTQATAKQTKTFKDNTKAVKKSIESTYKTTDAADKAKKSFDEFTNTEKALGNKTLETNRVVGEQRKNVKALDDTFNGMKGPATFSQKLTTFGSMAMSAAMALQALQSAINIFKDEDTSFWDKMVQLMMSLGMVIPMVTTAYSKQNIATLFNLKIKKGEAMAQSTDITLTWLQKIAKDALNGSMLKTLLLIGLMAAAFIALAAIIVGVVAIFKAISNAYNADAIAAEKAAQRANELAEAYKNVRQAYEDLKTSIADYGEAQLAINKLKEGTQEWRDAIEESNIQVMDMLEKYPELAEYVESVNGQLKITDPQAVLDIYRNRTNALYNASLDAKVIAKNAQNKADRTNFIRKTGDAYTGSDYAADVGMFGFVGGSIKGIISNSINADALEDAVSKISEAYKEDSTIFADFDQTLADLNITNKRVIEALKENKNALQNLVRSEKEALEYEKTVKQQKVNNILNNAGFNTSNSGTNINDLLIKKYDQEVANQIANNYNSDNWKNINVFGDAIRTGAGEDAVKQYAQLMGYKDLEIKNFKWNKVKIKYKKEGEDDYTTEKVDYADIEKILAEYAVSESDALVKYASRINNTITSLKDSESTLGQGIGSFLQDGNFDYTILTEEDRRKIAEGSIEAVFPKGTDLTQAAKDFGYESYAAMEAALQEAARNYDPVQAAANAARREAQEVTAILQEGATALETTSDALEMYASSLMKTNPELDKNKKLAAEIAVSHFQTAKGLNTLQKTFQDYANVLQKADKNSLDYYEALGKLNQAIEETFGVKVSADFLENEENLKDLEKAANNDTEALARLKKAVNEDFILNLNINEDTKNILNSKIQELQAQAQNSPIGTSLTLNDSDAIAALNEALFTGEATIEQIESMFNNANLQMPEYKTHWVDGEVTRSHSETTTTGPLGIQFTSSSDTVTTAKKAIPYFGDTPPTVNKETGEATSYGGGGSMTITTAGNAASDQNVLSYQGDDAKSDKNEKKEIERYKEISEELSDVERELDKIAKAKERAFGSAKLKLMDQEIAKSKELLDTEKKYLAEIEGNYQKDLQNLSSRFQLDPSSGRITNYTAVLEDLAGQVANNTLSSEKYEEIKKAADQYIETLNLLEEQQTKVNDVITDNLDMEIARIEAAVEIQLSLNESDLSYFEYLIDRLDDTADNIVKKFNFLGMSMDSHFNNIKTIEQGIYDILGKSLTEDQVQAIKDLNIDWNSEGAYDQFVNKMTEILDGKELDAGTMSALSGYFEQLKTEGESLATFYESFMEPVNEYFEEMNDNAEKAINRNEQLTGHLETFQNVIDLVGMEALGVSYEQLEQLNKANVTAARDNLKLKQEQLNMNKDALATAQAALQDAQNSGDEEAVKYWQEQVDTIQENVWQLESEVGSAWTETLQAIADAFVASVKNATDEFEKAMTGKWGSYEKMQEVFDQEQEISDRYVDDYKKIYELSKLTRDLNNSIDNTDSIKGKQALRDLQEEINELTKDGRKVSQYELDHLRKKYELRVAEIALEEAQNAKSQVRMQRDYEGNWSYVYTADEAKIDAAQQNFEDKLFAIQDLEQNYIDEMQSRVIQAEVDMVAAINALRVEDFATQEEYQAEVERITRYYTGMREYALTELNTAIEDSKETYENDYKNYYESTNKQLGVSDTWVTEFGKTALAIAGDYDSIDDARSRHEQAVTGMVTKLTDPTTGAYATYLQAVKDTFKDMGLEFDNFGGEEGTLQGHINAITEKLGLVNQKFGTYAQSASDGFGGIVQAAQEKFKTFGPEIKKWNDKIDGLLAKIAALNNTQIKTPENPTDDPEKDPPEKPTGPQGTQLQGGNDDGNTGDGATIPDGWTQVTYHKSAGLLGDTEWLKVNDLYYDIAKMTKGVDYSVTDDGKYLFNTASQAEGYQWVKDIDTVMNVSSNRVVDGVTYSNIGGAWHSANDIARATVDGTKINLLRLGAGVKLDESVLQLKTGEFIVSKSNTINLQRYKRRYGVTDADTTDGLTAGKYYWEQSAFDPAYGYIRYADNDAYVSSNKDNWGSDVVKEADLFKKTDIVNAMLGGHFNGRAFDTGGYTGEWDSTGRLAMLHQKEIVLNAHDTENFLSAINIVRDIASAIDLKALSQQNALARYAQTAAAVDSAAQMLQQEVTIHAEFPNATQRGEIEAAFDTLLNRASQFANRKK